MGRAVGLLGTLIALAIGAYLYTQQAKSVSKEAGNPRSTIDVAGVKMDLLNMAQAERAYNAREGHYASLEDLRSSGDLVSRNDHRGPYNYSASVTGDSFTITASYAGPPNQQAPASFSIDQTMEVH